ncbi:erythrocyte membrane protein 1 [Plasmodium falciparum NF54]|uniref:Erythrocyte membrane protein 1, PfEMP1 n=6 Tax=Plasmodium falciparum TaxID=5833 RepID=O96296_PLAF7|nr:erythrocyte membrane protein 1, PfEMP1 [Plasmodium falciparum 3D7]KAF4331280.1 erythrocyte membrane protein 1 [Plasmodium falciparum NF54]PKC46308.1 erythrocyte membrane protein 1 [Plasmodium falciparum NF54]CZT98247.1 erythrocyte membrane protein 1, PfEMP1 [Plasmodium falciparum 3D7]|eukprot:XP_001349737.2 erythrocyte membrane protein 1, PfEMP1 [Plasmodium falciparum 3D7]
MGSGKGGDPQDESVKHMFDRIGEDVYEQVKSETVNYVSELEGKLSLAPILGVESGSTNETCNLVQDYYNKPVYGNSNRYPCKNLKGITNEERFSDTLGGQCTNKKIKGNEYSTKSGKDCGACAPYRRLHLCSHNLESIDTTSMTHKLLLEVCMAAKYEGNSIDTHYPQHQRTNEDSPSQICTMLARSFADIGDIVRGKDLFYGNSKEKEKRDELETNLKTIFGKIHEKLKDKEGAETRYGSDTTNYYQLREDWWYANRATVWEAITCDVHGSDYFRQTCGDKETTATRVKDKCRCKDENGKKPGSNADQVPTYFDYVPQYLRWFEEWAEDFCRKKKKKLEKLEQQCRDYKQNLYCSGNGYDCTKTIYKKGKLVIGEHCTNCSVWCRLYESWIDNQKLEFLKQKQKYETEISNSGSCGGSGGVKGRNRKKRGAGVETATNYDGYEKKFYKELKESEYGKVDDFLKLLNNEDVCKKIKDEKEKIDFTKPADKNSNNEGTFYHSEYCKPCPDCGVKRKDNQWKDKYDGKCTRGKLYEPASGAQGTPIKILKSGEKQKEIETKLKAFCDQTNGDTTNSVARGGGADGSGSKSNSKELYEEWKCYNEVQKVKDDKNGEEEDEDEEDVDKVKKAGGLCILENKKHESRNNSSNEPEQFQKTFHDFFYFWIGRFLNDSMYWRGKVNSCINNPKRKKCRNECKDDCGCFKEWIGKKKEEWENIKKHFKTQEAFKNKRENSGIDMFSGLMDSADVVLELALELEQLFQDIKDGYGDVKELKGIKELLDEEKKKKQAEEAVVVVVADNQKKTTIDKLLQHEGDDANNCLKTHKEKCEETQPKPPGAGGPGAPSETGETTTLEDEEEEEDEEEDAGDEVEEGETVDTTEGDETETVEQPVKDTDREGEEEEAKKATDTTTSLDVCDTVKNALTNNDNLTDACKLKYGPGGKERFPNWKCVSSGEKSVATAGSSGATGKSGDKGAICVPPRRRRLYVGGLTKLTSAGTSSESPQGGSESSRASDVSQGNGGDDITTTESLRKWFIETAAIETFFLWHRYKKEWEAQKKAELQRNGLLLGTGASLNLGGDDSNPQTQLQKSGTIPLDFLRLMFYTLGDYRDILVRGVADDKNGGNNIILNASGNKDEKQKMEKIQEKIEQILPTSGNKETRGPQNSVNDRQSLWDRIAEHVWHGMVCALTYKDDDNGLKGVVKKPQKIENPEKLWNETTKKPKDEKYQYQTAKLEDESGEKRPDSSASGTKLTDFIKRPPYFRYLEEWGENFCKKRTEMLGKIKEDCYKNGGRCSGDGLKCNEIVIDKEKIFGDLLCPTCARHCRFYKKWINTKRDEFNKQSNAYSEQKKKYEEENDSAQKNNGVCGTLKDDAAEFLNRLKNGPCKNESEENKKAEDEIDFKKPDDTFKDADNCKPCSEFKIKCENHNCSSGGNTQGKCDGKTTIAATEIENIKTNTKEVTMLVSDDSKSATEFKDGLSECKDKGIFKGIRKDEWECGKVCGVDICNLKKKDNIGKESDKKYIIMKELLKRWLEYFLEDYNKIKHKISHCTKNGKGSKCIKGCVDKWVQQKKEEWKQIKERFNEQYKSKTSDEYFNVKSFLETWIPKIAVVNDQDNVIKLSKFGNSCGCSASAISTNGNEEDAIDCMIKKLEKKIDECKRKPGENSGQTCNETLTHPLDVQDEDEPLEETEENPVGKQHPSFCPPVEDKKKEEEGETCTPASPAPAPAPAPASPSPTPAPADEPFDPTILQTTIPLGIALALGSIAFLFLKKKTKHPVDLFSVINIPKSDYDIPTKLSPNRYIPYTSGKYRGKRYIYLEGDSGTDSGYTDHYSDITSSSESEYEEMDINDIYVPGSPKYKTLIEVVLEPSGNNTTASDTQNDIQNDGIPSNKFSDNEWNTLKDDFISNMLQNQPKDVPNDYKSGDIPFNTQPNTLYFDKPEEKPFITSIHDRNLLNGEEYSYNVNMSTNSMDDPKYVSNNVYSGIDLINDSLSGNKHIDIYDEVLKRKENELFGTNHVKHTSIHSVAKNTNSDPILNQINLFHTWLDRHRDMCEKWENHHERLAKLKEEWENETHSGNTHPSDSNKTLNTDVSIQIHMDNPKPINQFTNMDTILEDLDKPFNEPYYYDMYDDDIYYDVNDHDTSTVDTNAMDVPSKVQIEMDVNTKLVKEKYPIADVWDI